MNQNHAVVPQMDNVKLFFKRNAIYKTGLILLFPCLVVYVVSFCFDSWFSSQDSSFGFWKSCYNYVNKCRDTDKLNETVALQIISLIFLAGICVAIILGLVENCYPRPPNYRSRKLEWIVLSTAIIGLAEISIFTEYFVSLWGVSIGISFLLNAIVVTMLFIASGFLAYGNRKSNAGQVVSTPMTFQQPMTVVYRPPGPGAQTRAYNYHRTPNPQTQFGAPFGPANSNFAAPPPSYGAYPNVPCASSPPPYMLPPMYPNQGSQQSYLPLPPPYEEQKQQDQHQQLEASAPLMTKMGGHMKR